MSKRYRSKQSTAAAIEALSKNPLALTSLVDGRIPTIPELLAEIREHTHLGYREFGDLLGLSHVQFGRVLRGKKPYLQETELVALIRAFNLPPEQVVYGNALGRFNAEQLQSLGVSRELPVTQDDISNEKDAPSGAVTLTVTINYQGGQKMETVRVA